jgi:DNA-binding response OmpR family regulator
MVYIATMLTLLLVEDNQEVATFIQEYLGRGGYNVLRASTGSRAHDLFAQTQPDLIILDLDLPDVRGETLCEEFKQMNPEIPIIMLTGASQTSDVVRGLNIGADDYITKPFEGKELTARIKARLRERGLSNKILRVEDLTLNTETMEVFRGERQISLTPQEFRLLEYLMLNPNRVLTRDMILSRVWQTAPDIETRVVDVYVGYLRKKIDQGEKLKLITSVRGFGYTIKTSKTVKVKNNPEKNN